MAKDRVYASMSTGVVPTIFLEYLGLFFSTLKNLDLVLSEYPVPVKVRVWPRDATTE